MNLLTKMASRFVAGESQVEAWMVVQDLNNSGIGTTLDILGENVSDTTGAEKMTTEYCSVLQYLDQQGISEKGRNVSVKLTMLGLDLSRDLCLANMRKILDVAKQFSFFVRIDMEGSKYTDSILDVFYILRKEYESVGVVLQASLKRTYADIKNVLDVHGRIRLCKGAYKEPESIAFQNKYEIRNNYLRCADLLISDSSFHGFATHDSYLINELDKRLQVADKDKSTYEFQMLYGMRKASWYQRVKDGYNFRVYVPYGTDWLPYFGRRLRERKENIFFVLANLFTK